MEKQVFSECYKRIENARYILLLTHKNPDPDTLGSALALSAYLHNKRIKHKIYNETKTIPHRLSFLEGSDKITDQLPQSFDLVIYLDCSEDFMVGIEIDKNIFSIVFDHHETSKTNGNINIIDPKSASTGEIIYDYFFHNNIAITKKMAEALYVSIYGDTVGFTTPRTTSQTFEKITKLVEAGINPAAIANNLIRKDSLAKYRALPKVLETLELHFEGNLAVVFCKKEWIEQSGVEIQELDNISNMVLNIAIVKVVAYFREVNGSIRVSLRGKSDIDLSKVAKFFNGGGHKDAAGLLLEVKSIEKAKEQFLNYFKNYTFD